VNSGIPLNPEGTLNYTYDVAGNVASIYSSSVHGASMAYTYDSLNRLSTVVDNNLPADSNTTAYAYDTASNLVTVTDPNKLQSTIQYDSLNRLTSLNTATPNSSAVAGYSYTLGATGNRTGATEQTGRTLTWNYDGIYRLTSEAVSNDQSGGNGEVDYTLDPVGNRTSTASSLPGVPSVSLASFNLDDWLSPETYDANGNTLTTGGKTFTYDSENHLTSMNGGAVTMIYDAFGNRVAKKVGNVTTTYLVEDDVNPTGLPQVFEESVNGVLQRTYTYGLQRISENQIISNTWQPSFYMYDGFGSVRQLTNLSGTVTDTYNYDAFGNLLNSTGSTPNNYLYRGEQYDPDLGLYYLRARYYNPQTGRFLSRDPEDGNPFDEVTLHKYLYAGSNPVSYVDPSGKGFLDYITPSENAIPMSKLVSIYGCVSSVGFTVTSIVLESSFTGYTMAGIAGTAFGCVTAFAPAQSSVKLVGLALKLVPTINYGFCGASLAAVVNDFSGLSDSKSPNASAAALVDSLGTLTGCVATRLGQILEQEE
jgi:RHS repeat-associated protein